MRRFSLAIVFVLAGLNAAHPVSQGPIAIIEEIEGNPPDIEKMDFVRAGKVIRLGATDTIILSYLISCQRETITGATVTVGPEQSEVQGGNVIREKVACDGGRMEITRELSGKSGGAIFRDAPSGNPQPLLALRPQFLIYGRSPVVALSGHSPVLLERMDRSGERYKLEPDPRKLKGAFYDFADDGKTLAPGGVYRATMGQVQVLFQIDIGAQPGRTPLSGRLLLLHPEN
jgi:hypothetical protein